VSISATKESAAPSATLTVTPAAISTVTSPASVVGGNNVTGTVTLTGAAPPGGAVVTLSSSNTSAATVPASVTVAANTTSATLTATARGVASAPAGPRTGPYLPVPKTAAGRVNRASLTPLGLSETPVSGGPTSTGPVTLDGKAPPAGAVVTLSSSN